MTGFVTWFAGTVGKYISPKLAVFLVSMIPLIEERGGLLLARLLNLPLKEAVFWCVFGNILPIPFLLFGTKKLFHWMANHHLSKIVDHFYDKAQKNKERIEKYEILGLMLFVGIPLPGTGAWSGSVIATILDLDVKKASISILLGVAMAAVIMTLVSYGGLGSLIG